MKKFASFILAISAVTLALAQGLPTGQTEQVRVQTPSGATNRNHYKFDQGADYVFYGYIIEAGTKKSVLLPEQPKTVALTSGGIVDVQYELKTEAAEASLVITGKREGATTLIVQTANHEMVVILCQVVTRQSEVERYQKRFADIEARLSAVAASQ